MDEYLKSNSYLTLRSRFCGPMSTLLLASPYPHCNVASSTCRRALNLRAHGLSNVIEVESTTVKPSAEITVLFPVKCRANNVARQHWSFLNVMPRELKAALRRVDVLKKPFSMMIDRNGQAVVS